MPSKIRPRQGVQQIVPPPPKRGKMFENIMIFFVIVFSLSVIIYSGRVFLGKNTTIDEGDYDVKDLMNPKEFADNLMKKDLIPATEEGEPRVGLTYFENNKKYFLTGELASDVSCRIRVFGKEHDILIDDARKVHSAFEGEKNTQVGFNIICGEKIYMNIVEPKIDSIGLMISEKDGIAVITYAVTEPKVFTTGGVVIGSEKTDQGWEFEVPGGKTLVIAKDSYGRLGALNTK